MRRPFVIISIVFILFLSGLRMLQWSEEDRLLLQTEQILADMTGEDNTVTVGGTVNKSSRMSSGIRLFLHQVTVQPDSESEFSLLPDTQITITTEYETIVPGDHLYVRGKIAFWESASNPGQFDTRGYYFAEQTVCALDKAEILQHISGKSGIKRSLHMLKRTLEHSFWRILDEKEAGTIAAICLGEKGAMDTEWKETFQEGGIAHILAVSGLHISIIGMGIYRMLRRCGCPITMSVLSSGIMVWLYAWMTGFSISAVRAALMFLIWLGAQYFGRKYDMFTAVSVAAVCLMIRDSCVLQNSSFLLSFSAVLVLAILVPVVHKTCMIQSAAVNNLMSGILIWTGTLPVTLYFFYQTAPWSFLLNLLVIPLMSLIMTCGLAAAAAGCFYTSAGVFLAAPVHYLLRIFEWLCRMEKKLPEAIWIAGRPKGWKIVVFYLILGAGVFVAGLLHVSNIPDKRNSVKDNIRQRRKVYGIRGMWMLTVILCLAFMKPEVPSKLHIICLDVGQGDGAVLQMPTGEVFLVDGGSLSEGSVWKYRIEKTLKYYGISQIDGIFLSHDDQDHISGIEEYLEEYPDGILNLECLYLPPGNEGEHFSEMKRKAVQAAVEVCTMAQGAVIASEEGTWKIECLAPAAETLSGDKNADSMVLKVSYGEFEMIFTGDMEGAAEKRLIQNTAELDADVLNPLLAI